MHFNFDTPFMEAFEELNKLTEATATERQEARNWFWLGVRPSNTVDKYIDIESFHTAYDDELTQLGLMDLFNAEGLLTNRGTWGSIKAARETNPDSPAVKALSSLWGAQFKDNLKVEPRGRQSREATAAALAKAKQEREEQAAKRRAELDAMLQQRAIEMAKEEEEKKRREEERERERAEKAARDAEEQAKLKAAKEKNLQKVLEILNTNIKPAVEAVKAEYLPKFEKLVALADEVVSLSRGIIDEPGGMARGEKYVIDDLNNVKADDLIVQEYKHSYYSRSWLNDDSTKNKLILELVDKHSTKALSYSSSSKIELTADEVLAADETQLTKKLERALTSILVNSHQHYLSLDKLQELRAKVMEQVATAKKVQAAVNAGQPADPEFVSKIEKNLTSNARTASRERASWSSVQDGSDGLVYANYYRGSMHAIGVYLANCNWRAMLGDKQIESSKTSYSDKDICAAIGGLFDKVANSTNETLTIEIIKD